ncbi:hypothetical protein [Oscillatoria salina]|uniref:hypothetical protein n=1 Tax=Oscillatoria salina TaxID=331517 RepID=UPI0013BBBB2D|nr:hypothetical protein [Oscillatoria salina]MBZ8178648.1 hypothetical protein [Oscillatoria salina IIICB1]NET87306.1 hypothetical protein [Kamptonema sp. SIO1D9]
MGYQSIIRPMENQEQFRMNKKKYQDITLGQYNTEPQFDEENRQVPASEAQEQICDFFLKTVQKHFPEVVLQAFEQIFITLNYENHPAIQAALYEIIGLDREKIFRATLKRSCYILVNNWSARRQFKYIQELIDILSEVSERIHTQSITKRLLRQWLLNFLDSEDYEELKLFVSGYKHHRVQGWSNRYASYLLASQAVDYNKPKEQREAAKAVSRQLKEQFKFDLAMYTARFNSALSANTKQYKNPTHLGEDVLRLIQKIIVKRGKFSYENIANIFLKQTEGLYYEDFKLSLLKYLIHSLDNRELGEILNKNMASFLESLYESYNDEIWDTNLLLRTSNRLIEFLTTQKKGEPTELFTLLATQGKYLTLVIVLLKILMICKQSYSHLETCIASLIKYYEQEPESECQWLIVFLETLRVTLTIYTDNVNYNLITMEAASNMDTETLKNCRIFSQVRSEAKAKDSSEE